MFTEESVLSNGISIPRLGFGTYLIPEENAAEAVRAAIGIGYRHIDTAQAYENEHGVGEGIRASGIAREDIFVTSKVMAEYKSYDEAVRSIDESLSVSKLGWFDLMLIHCPQPWDEYGSEYRYPEENRAVWKALEEAYEAGRVRAIGVSNFNEWDIDSLLVTAKIKPMVNQFACFAGYTDLELINKCFSLGILPEAYSPLGHGDVFANKKLAEIAERYGVTVSRLCIRYTLQLGMISIPKTVHPDRMKENTLVDFVISNEDMELLKSM